MWLINSQHVNCVESFDVIYLNEVVDDLQGILLDIVIWAGEELD